MNPDGYQYTFQSPDTRLWRKTLRDNNGNGTIEVGDGVDPNRNYPEHWNYDDEGSSGVQSSDTYRGPAAESEPETQAMRWACSSRIGFAFQVNYHSFGEWLLYPEGWQIGAPTADDPIYYALSGNLDNPAIPGFNPGLSSDVLYVTNGETTDYAHVNTDTLAWTPELSDGGSGLGFVFPDDEALVAGRVREPAGRSPTTSRSRPRIRRIRCRTSVSRRSRSTSRATTPTRRASRSRTSSSRSRTAIRRRCASSRCASLGKVDAQVPHQRRFREDRDDDGVERRREVRRRRPTSTTTSSAARSRAPSQGDSVQVWFEEANASGTAAEVDAATTEQEGREERVLHLHGREEERTACSSSPPRTTPAPRRYRRPGPHYLSYYLNALAANGIGADVYDVDANGRKAPDALGVLSHYKAVIWYTGDDTVTREPGWGAGNASRLAMDELFEMRDYLNEGGRVLYTGRNAGAQYTPNLGAQLYDPTAANGHVLDPPVNYGAASPVRLAGDGQNDILEYWFGAYLMNYGAGAGRRRRRLRRHRGGRVRSKALDRGRYQRCRQRRQPDGANSFITTSGILPAATYPQFESWAAAKYARPGGPFDPHTGRDVRLLADRGRVVQAADEDVHRPGRRRRDDVLDVVQHRGATGTHVFVEVHTVGQNNWTTLPDAERAHDDQTTGQSCPLNVGRLADAASVARPLPDAGRHGACTPTGTTGVVERRLRRLPRLAAVAGQPGRATRGQQVEVSISYASDWATQGLGVFVDDVTLPDGTTTSFETGLDGWTMPGQPAGSAPNANDFIRTTAAGFPEGAVVATPDTIYMGFGFEGISDAATRNAVMGRAMNYLLRP